MRMERGWDLAKKSNKDDSCQVGAQAYIGSRAANGNTNFIVPKRNVTDFTYLPFSTSQLKEMDSNDVNYFTSVLQGTEEAFTCGFATCGSSGSSTSVVFVAFAVIVTMVVI